MMGPGLGRRVIALARGGDAERAISGPHVPEGQR